ncbi:hypothetical protein ACIQZG_22620 [Lysinibacillus sp. NPDC096418]|uniref:hypothetical protein n=1 Tax=Lysinibacillus sp. NPDC096418 TaxID=3364138 RepID=UPI003823E235
MEERLKKIEERIGKREERIEKLLSDLKEEKKGLKKDKETLVQLKYDGVIKQMQENGVSPDVALRAIDNVIESNQESRNNIDQQGGRNHANNY